DECGADADALKRSKHPHPVEVATACAVGLHVLLVDERKFQLRHREAAHLGYEEQDVAGLDVRPTRRLDQPQVPVLAEPFQLREIGAASVPDVVAKGRFTRHTLFAGTLTQHRYI